MIGKPQSRGVSTMGECKEIVDKVEIAIHYCDTCECFHLRINAKTLEGVLVGIEDVIDKIPDENHIPDLARLQ